MCGLGVSGLPKAFRWRQYYGGDAEDRPGGGDRLGRDSEALAGEVAHEVLQSTSLLAQHVRGGNDGIIEEQFGGFLCGQPDLLQLTTAFETGGVPLDHEEAEIS